VEHGLVIHSWSQRVLSSAAAKVTARFENSMTHIQVLTDQSNHGTTQQKQMQHKSITM